MKVFISYRRSDAYWPAQKLSAALSEVIPGEDVFIDVDSIPAGIEFKDYIEQKLNETDILFAIIGKRWATETNADTGERRISESDDLVRLEIASALSKGIKVVPILVDGAQLPDKDILPESLHRLLTRNAVIINNQSFESDTKRLIRLIGFKRGLLPRVSLQKVHIKYISVVVAFALLALFLGLKGTMLDRSPSRIAIDLVEKHIGSIEQSTPEVVASRLRDCYQMAGHNLDPKLPAGIDGKSITDLGQVSTEAELVCGRALTGDPTNPSLLWMYSRILASVGDRNGQIEFLTAAQGLGSTEAGVTLAIRLMEGRGLAVDYGMAKELLDMAANNGDPRAIGLMSVFPSYGLTVPMDKKRAYQLNFDAASRGLSRSQHNVCVQKVHGIGVQMDPQFGAGFCQTAAQSATDPVAQNFYGWLLENGIGVEKNLSSAKLYYDLSASGKYRLAYLNQARMLIKESAHDVSASEVAKSALHRYLDSEFDHISDDVYWVYELNPSEMDMVDEFIAVGELVLSLNPDGELNDLLFKLTQGRRSGRYPIRVILQPPVGSYKNHK